jgi:hypothetical protein
MEGGSETAKPVPLPQERDLVRGAGVGLRDVGASAAATDR